MTLLAFLLRNTGPTSTMHLNNIPDEGEALTSNPLTKRQSSRKAFKQTNKPCNTRQLWKLSLFQKKQTNLLKKKKRLYHNSCVCRFFSSFVVFSVWRTCGKRWDLSCALLDVFNIVAVFWLVFFLTLKEHHYKTFCHHSLFFFFCTLKPPTCSFQRGLGSVLTNHGSFGSCCLVWVSPKSLAISNFY